MAVQRAAVFVSFNRLSKKQGSKDKRTRPRPLLVFQFSLSEEFLPVETLRPGCKRRESLALVMQSSNVHKPPVIKTDFNGNQRQQQMKTSRCISASLCIYFFIFSSKKKIKIVRTLLVASNVPWPLRASQACQRPRRV